MNKFLAVILLLASGTAKAQSSRMVVQFADKNNTPYRLNAPAQFLSDRSVARRLRYHIDIDSTDLPVVPDYITQVKAQGAWVLSQSKWLNQVLISTTDSLVIQRIRSLPFVKGLNSVAPVADLSINLLRQKHEVLMPELPVAATSAATAADIYNYGNAYNQVHIHLGEFLHNKGYSGQGMLITILDAGFNNYRTNTAFDSVRMQGHVLGEKDFVAFDNSVAEDDTHGKNCFSIIAANWPGRMVGTATKADFWLVRTEDAPTENPVEEFNWVVGAEFADSCGTDLITSSLGYTVFDNPVFDHTYSDFYNNSATVTKGAALAVRKGMIVTNSAGNDGASAWKYLGFPADADSVCAVGAVNTLGVIAAFSSYGYLGKQKPNVVSVGTATVIAGATGPTTGNGTSYSNPNMAGLITCLWQAFPAFNNMKILGALYASGNRNTNPDNRYGYGIPNMKTAYQSLKKEENQMIYGNDWYWVVNSPFIDTLAVRYIGQLDGTARIELLDGNQQVVRSFTFTAEVQEVVNHTFTNLSALPDALYTVRYTDSLTTRLLPAMKPGLLPLSFLTINALRIGNAAAIEWRASAGADYFHIQKSTDAITFKNLSRVTASVGAGSEFLYRYNDPDAKNPVGLDLFYRIEGIDKNNRKIYSSTARLPQQTGKSSMVVYPNPANDVVQLSVITALHEAASILITNTHGQLLQHIPVELSGGSNTLTVPLNGIAAGDYIITVKTATQTFHHKIMVRR